MSYFQELLSGFKSKLILSVLTICESIQIEIVRGAFAGAILGKDTLSDDCLSFC